MLRNRNASGKRVAGERIAVTMSVSERNGLRPLFIEYLRQHGLPPSEEEVKRVASEWGYQGWRERLSKAYQEQDAQLQAATLDFQVEREHYQRLAADWNALTDMLCRVLGIQVYSDGQTWTAEFDGKKRTGHTTVVEAFETAVRAICNK